MTGNWRRSKGLSAQSIKILLAQGQPIALYGRGRKMVLTP